MTCIVTPRVKRTQAPPPKTSEWPYPDPTPGGTPTCSERFPNMLVHTILDEWTDGFDEIEEVDLCILDIAPSNRTTHKR